MAFGQARAKPEIDSSDGFLVQFQSPRPRLGAKAVHGRVDIGASLSQKEQNRSVRVLRADLDGRCGWFSEHFGFVGETERGVL